jgi:hypothetical protein
MSDTATAEDARLLTPEMVNHVRRTVLGSTRGRHLLNIATLD